MTGLTTGLWYTFRIEAKNENGYSSPSNPVKILAAQTPAAPGMPTTVTVGPDIIISWPEVYDNGSPITSYDIVIKGHDENYYTELEYCDGTDPDVLANRQCTLPLTTLYAAPFNMILGDHIYVIITANNLYGASLESVPGDGAAIVFLPEAPLNLANNAAITSAKQIGLTWSEGISDGGKDVEDYRIWYD